MGTDAHLHRSDVGGELWITRSIQNELRTQARARRSADQVRAMILGCRPKLLDRRQAEEALRRSSEFLEMGLRRLAASAKNLNMTWICAHGLIHGLGAFFRTCSGIKIQKPDESPRSSGWLPYTPEDLEPLVQEFQTGRHQRRALSR